MADFKGGDVVVVPMPVNPEMVLWALPGPAGDIPYADVENLVDAEVAQRIDTMTQLEASTAASAGAATTAAGTATAKASDASTSEANALAYRNTASTAAGTATTQAGIATAAAGTAEQYALEFDLGVTATTGAPGSNVVATVTGTGPAYQINLTIPRGVKGETGDNGEISQAQLDAAVATLVDNAPEALNTLSELATSLGNDPNFATTISTEIGLRAKTADVDAALAGKANASHTHSKAQVGLANVDNTSDATKPISTATQAALDGKSNVGHQHPVTDLTATGTRSASTYLRGDGSWQTPTSTTYSVPTQAEAETGTATTARAFTAQRVRQAIDARAVTRQGSTQGLWIGTTASLPTTGTTGVLYVTY